jgi:hypothetical protein
MLQACALAPKSLSVRPLVSITKKLAYEVDSLVRVSRRVRELHPDPAPIKAVWQNQNGTPQRGGPRGLLRKMPKLLHTQRAFDLLRVPIHLPKDGKRKPGLEARAQSAAQQ